MKLPTRRQMIAAGRSQYQSEGEIEIDDNAKLSRAEGNPDEALLFKHGFGFQMKKPPGASLMFTQLHPIPNSSNRRLRRPNP